MSALAQFQRALAAQVLTGDPSVAALVLDSTDFSRHQRLEVYSQAYGLRLTETLAQDFPALRTLLGEAGFTRMAASYIATHPSQSFTLRDFGHALATHLCHSAGHRRRPWLREVAAFEWALAHAFDGADTPTLGRDALAAIAPQRFARLRLRFVPAMGLLSQRWNVPALWHAAQAGEPPAPRRQVPAAWCLVWRQELRVYFRTLEADEAALLRALRRGEGFAAACGALAAVTTADNPALRAASLLAGWADAGMLEAAIP